MIDQQFVFHKPGANRLKECRIQIPQFKQSFDLVKEVRFQFPIVVCSNLPSLGLKGSIALATQVCACFSLDPEKVVFIQHEDLHHYKQISFRVIGGAIAEIKSSQRIEIETVKQLLNLDGCQINGELHEPAESTR